MTAAIYCRLSKEDEEKQAESESIQNQRSLLVRYAVDNGWDIYQIYCDEDYSGIDRERPAFQRMLEDAEKRKFQIILVKTQSRFTRDMELVEKYIHGAFPEWGIRFIAVVDHADTELKGNKKARQINALINEWYLEDLSENIKAVFDHKKRSGQYLGGFPIYGYQRDPNDRHHLIVEPDSAEVVKRIFRMYLEGNGTQRIADELNREGIPNPTKQKQLLGWNYANGNPAKSGFLWNRNTVSRILKEEMYTGNLVQGRHRKISYKSKKVQKVPQQDWIVVPHTHEAIIDQDTFQEVSRRVKSGAKAGRTGEVQAFAGIAVCMGCGSPLEKTTVTYRGERRSYLRCRHSTQNPCRCSGCSIRLDVLEQLILERLKLLVRTEYQYDIPALMTAFADGDRGKKGSQAETRRLKKEIQCRDKALGQLYLDRIKGELSEEQYLRMAQTFQDEKKDMERRLSRCCQQLDALQLQHTLEKKIPQWLDLDQLPRQLASEMIQTIEVGRKDTQTGRQLIRIVWRL